MAPRYIVLVQRPNRVPAFVHTVTLHAVGITWERDGALRFESRNAAIAAARRLDSGDVTATVLPDEDQP